MAFNYCYCHCNDNVVNFSEEKTNSTIPYENKPLEEDPRIRRCDACNGFLLTDSDHSNNSNSIADVENEICRDFLFVEGNQTDLDQCQDECTLMERVWLLSKPPLIEKQMCVVPARRIQVIRERLSSTVKCIPTLKKDLKLQIERNLNARRRQKKSSKYVGVRRISFEDELNFNTLPPCAQKLSEFM